MKTITPKELEDKQEEVHNLGEQYLYERGWKYKCNHPDSCWRWEKKINGRIYVMSYSDALALQMYMEDE